jgi:hypothetical protein
MWLTDTKVISDTLGHVPFLGPVMPLFKAVTGLGNGGVHAAGRMHGRHHAGLLTGGEEGGAEGGAHLSRKQLSNKLMY